MEKHIELAKKLKALSDRGVGGEKATAVEMLNALLKKHNITIEEIEGEKIEDYYFNIKVDQRGLWHQVIEVVNPSIKCFGMYPRKLVKKLQLKGNCMIKCTASEYVEIEAKFDFYEKLYKVELNVFWIAFLNANNLLVDDLNKNKTEPTDADHKKWARVRDMSEKITKGNFLRQLP